MISAYHRPSCPAAKFFDNLDLPPTASREAQTWAGAAGIAPRPPKHWRNLDTSAWHNYTWDMSYALNLVCFRSSGELSEGMPT